MSASFSASVGPGNALFRPKCLGILRSVEAGECFLEVAEGSGLNSTTSGWMDVNMSRLLFSIKHRMRLSLNQEILGKKGTKDNFQEHWRVNITVVSSTNQTRKAVVKKSQDLFRGTKQMKCISLKKVEREPRVICLNRRLVAIRKEVLSQFVGSKVVLRAV